MSLKNTITKADYLPHSDYKRLVQALIDEGKYWWATYCILSFCTGLRFSDVQKIKWNDILGKRQLRIVAKKTKKTHTIPIGVNASEYFSKMYDKLGRPDKDSYVLAGKLAEDGKPVSIQYVNRYLKTWVRRYDLDIENFSTHTFRKTFGRYVYEKSGRDNSSILYLNRIFKHANLETTMVYLGIRDDEISSVFNSLDV